MTCTNHVDKPASGACVYCGKFYCSDCLVEVNGKMYCKADIGKVLNEAKESAKANAGPTVFMNAGGASSSSSSSSSSSATTSAPVSTPVSNPLPTNLIPFKSRTTAAILAIFLGGFGVHKFYLGKASGIWYLLFCWTLIPSVIGIIEGIIYLTMSDYEFAVKFGGRPA